MIAAFLVLVVAPAGPWETLFDGRSALPEGWAAEDGLVRTIQASPLLTRDLYSKPLYSDFEFEVEYRVSPGGNSGIRYLPLVGTVAGVRRVAAVCAGAMTLALLALRRRRWLSLMTAILCLVPIPPAYKHLQQHPLSLEFQLLDNEGHPDGKRGGLYRAGALYGLSPVLAESSGPAGSWNAARVVVCGSRTQHWLNGKLAVDVDMASPQHIANREHFYTQGWYRIFSEGEWRRLGRDRPSAVGLQHHGEEVWFRGARIRAISCESSPAASTRP